MEGELGDFFMQSSLYKQVLNKWWMGGYYTLIKNQENYISHNDVMGSITEETRIKEYVFIRTLAEISSFVLLQ